VLSESFLGLVNYFGVAIKPSFKHSAQECPAKITFWWKELFWCSNQTIFRTFCTGVPSKNHFL